MLAAQPALTNTYKKNRSSGRTVADSSKISSKALLKGATMQGKIVWQQSSTKPENPNLAFISQWWSSLAEANHFAQRPPASGGEMDELNWEPQRFDEVLS